MYRIRYFKTVPILASVIAVIVAAGISHSSASSTAVTAMQGTGTIKGHVRLSGKNPGNAVIRMGVDPMCDSINAGKRVLQEAVLTSADGGLKNVFVKLQGTFPQSPVPRQPVVLDQRGCVYAPRVLGMRVGQTLQIKNNDPLLHNVHSVSEHANDFNMGQATAGIVSEYRPKSEEVMLRLRCDVHRWMTAYIGVVSHPYFAVSGDGGAFEIDNVPPGTQTVQIWHEAYGILTKTVRVQAGTVANMEFSYTGAEKPSTN
jgi:plastocyanin